MLSLHTNSAALSAQSSISKTQQSLSTSMTRLSTGYRINSAMDDAAGLQIATRLKAQTSGMAMAMRNTQNATSMIQTADGALGETVNILVRMKDLATQAADGSSTADDRKAMQAEFDTLTNELSNVLGNTSFAGAKLMSKQATAQDSANAKNTMEINKADVMGSDGVGATDGKKFDMDEAKTAYDAALLAYQGDPTDAALATDLVDTGKTLADTTKLYDVANAKYTASVAYEATVDASFTSATNGNGKFAGNLDFQIGASTTESMSFDLSSQLTAMHAAIGGATKEYNSFGAASASAGTELTGVGTASTSIDKLQTAIDAVGTARSALGAAGNRLDHVATNLANVSTNTQGASGRIMDTDFATESSNMTASQMLLQAGTAMLKQSNSMSSMVMSLLQ
ncbi:flagellin [Janthinobacterium sp. 35]|uniref:flagellin N-terminal helical domain-containing protein n=1 Tax=Janthinobacterium sp. 35 TaxID=2035210 RepID=UPI000C5BA342|nr:flagellin [Janthinobacterium sp. 35]PIG25924.1 flagellin [Janthinobacterium sp. 35]